MNNQYIRLLLAVVLCVVTSCSTTRQLPVRETEGKDKREFRGAWIQTAFQGEYKDMTPKPTRLSATSQRESPHSSLLLMMALYTSRAAYWCHVQRKTWI